MKISDAVNKMNVILKSQRETNLVPLLLGSAGVGKTQVVRQYCEAQGLSLAYVNMADRQPGEFAVNFVTSDDMLSCAIDTAFEADVVLLDEINRAELCANEIMNITQSHSVRGVELDCLFVAAGNVGGSYDVVEFDAAQQGRFAPLHIDADINSFANYLSAKGYEKTTEVVSFIRKNNVLVACDDTVNPRRWEQLLQLGALDFAPILLPKELVGDYMAHMSTCSLPDYADVDGYSFPATWLQLDYALGAIDQPISIVEKIAMLLAKDILGLFLENLSERNIKVYNELFKPTSKFVAYVESIKVG